MTDVCAARGEEHEQQGPPAGGQQREGTQQQRGGDQPGSGRPGGSSYLAVLRMPGALRFSSAGAVGRMTMSMFGLGSLLLISARTGRYGLAGVVAAAASVSYAVCAPRLASLADRFGQGRVLRPTAAVFGAATATFVACAQLGAPLWALLITACLSGAAMPSLGSMVRARWSALLGDSPMLGTAYALESVIDEMIFVIGPALATLLATEVQPAAGVVAAAALCVAGTLALARQADTAPAVLPDVSQVSGRPGRGGGRRLAAAGRRQGARDWLPAPGLVTLAPAFGFLGSMFATIDLSTVAFAQQHGHRPLAGFLLGTYALGSTTGGIWYGSRAWRAPLERRFAITLCLTAAGVATFWSLPGLSSLALVLFFSGLTISPTLIAGFSLIERQAPPGRRTEGMTWLSSAVSVGVAAGAATTGHIVDAGGARWGYVFAAGCGGLAAVACVAGLGRLRGAPDGQAAQ